MTDLLNADRAPQLLKPEDAGKRLGVHADTVRRMVEAGEIEGIDVGTTKYPRLRISEDALKKFIDSRTVTPASANSDGAS